MEKQRGVDRERERETEGRGEEGERGIEGEEISTKTEDEGRGRIVLDKRWREVYGSFNGLVGLSRTGQIWNRRWWCASPPGRTKLAVMRCL